jgi:hypothetical protein
MIGGLVGVNEAKGRIEYASSSATIAGTQSAVGGLVAANYGAIRHSTSTATFTGNLPFVGGLVWFNDGSIESSSTSGPAANVMTIGTNSPNGTIDGKKIMGPVK